MVRRAFEPRHDGGGGDGDSLVLVTGSHQKALFHRTVIKSIDELREHPQY